MKIGAFTVPEIRLDELLTGTLKTIHDSVKTAPIQSRDLATLLGYTHGTEPALFKRINSMLAYGILEGRGIYNVTRLGENLLYPENEDVKRELRTQAIMNVEFWKKLYEKYGKNLPKEGLWVSIKTIAEVDPVTAKSLENRIYRWYMEDIANISLMSVSATMTGSYSIESSEGLSSNKTNTKAVSQAVIEVPAESFGRFILPNVGYVDVTDEDTLEIAKSYFKVLEKKVKSAKEDQNKDAGSEINDQ